MFFMFTAIQIPKIAGLKVHLKSFIDTYRKERRKVLCSGKSGAAVEDVHLPKLAWYGMADTFLKSVVVMCSRIQNIKVRILFHYVHNLL